MSKIILDGPVNLAVGLLEFEKYKQILLNDCFLSFINFIVRKKIRL